MKGLRRNAVCGTRRAEAVLRAGRQRPGARLRSGLVLRPHVLRTAVRLFQAHVRCDGARAARVRPQRLPARRLRHPEPRRRRRVVLRGGRDRAAGRRRPQPRRDDRDRARRAPPVPPARARRRRPRPRPPHRRREPPLPGVRGAAGGPAGEDVRRAWVVDGVGPTADDELRKKIVDTMCSVPLPVARASSKASRGGTASRP